VVNLRSIEMKRIELSYLINLDPTDWRICIAPPMDSADCKHEITLFGKATSGKDEIPDGPADMKFTIFVVFKMSRF